jgi:lysine 6-dehydrogenase
MEKIIVLGAGMVGRAIAIDLLKEGYLVTAADIISENLDFLKTKGVETIKTDLGNSENLQRILTPYDLVIGAVPGFMGYEVMKNAISAGKNMVDISFFSEDPFLLDELAWKNNVTVVTDCGVAPGMDNMFLGYHSTRMKVTDFECLVGGLPFARTMPYQYKAPFSPIDVIEEYLRPARIVKNHKVIIKPALSEPEYIEFQGVGTLEAFNTDGLRSLVHTMKIQNMTEKTLRYPGHIDLMKVFRDTGFFSQLPVSVKGVNIRPIDLTSQLLFPKWKLKEGEEEFTIMRVTIEGTGEGKRVKYKYELLDRYDNDTHTSSMARTTGYTCTAVAGLILKGKFSRKGVYPPEFVGMEKDCLNEILTYQKLRNIHYKTSREVFKNSDYKPPIYI